MPYQEYAGVSPRASIRLHLTLTISFLAALLTPASAWADDCSPAPELWGTNGRVNAIVCTSDAIYLGGDFTKVGLSTGCWAPINAVTGKRITSFPRIFGVVHACVSDGAGGWYIGGSFTKVGELARQNAVHILANRAVDPAWKPNADGAVRALAVSGRTVYAGGLFHFIGRHTRNNIAALDAATGLATAWNPNAGGVINALAVSGGTVYASGEFHKIGGQGRNYIAALDAATGRATAWNPLADEAVYAMALSRGTLYVGGKFHNIGGQQRNNIAALDVATGRATDWNPDARGVNGTVYCLALSGRRVYVGGNFRGIGGQQRNGIAALDATTGRATDWNPDAGDNYAYSNLVNALAVSGGTVYVGGGFYDIGRQTRRCLAAVDATIGLATAWNPNLDHDNYSVNALAVSGGTVYVGGSLQNINDQARSYIAALNPATGAPTPWNPDADGPVQAMARSGGIIYVGGAFHHIGGKARNHLAALDATTGLAADWNPDSNGEIRALAVTGRTVYAGGQFDFIGGKHRVGLAAISAQTGRASAWCPDPGSVNALAVSGGTVYAGGDFHYIDIDGKERNRLAAFSAKTGRSTDWNPNPDRSVRALAVAGRTVYVGGWFQRICGQPRSKLVAIDAASGRIPEAWKAHFGDDLLSIETLLVSGGTVYACGYQYRSSQVLYSQIFALDATSGKDLPGWSPPRVGGYARDSKAIRALALSEGMLYFGGEFTSVDDRPQYSITRFRLAH